MNHNSYARLLAMAALSFMAMYALMYAMVASGRDVYNNFNQAYMAALMAAPMVVIELVLMAGMYEKKRLNVALIAVSVLVGVTAFVLIRRQAAISDRQFLRSMIPHHSAAILMCERAPIRDSRVEELCGAIISSQRAEIAQMRLLLGEPAGE